ncbi:MAG: hypothetical protein LC104_04920 [Bacteroidales bacterium]|nr:hypothetical protein [Bacteroidales bacterium]
MSEREPLKIECEVHFERRKQSKILETGPAPARPPEPGHLPRITRLMALAIRCEQLLRDGVVRNGSAIAHLGHITRARVSQIMNLLNLAPDIQEAILFLPRVERGRAPILLQQLQSVALVPDWRKQRKLWAKLLQEEKSDQKIVISSV